MRTSAPSPLPEEASRELRLADGRVLAVRVYGRRQGAATPLVLHFHGGAFIDGDLDSGARLARLLADSGAVVVSLAYPLAPAHRFPEAVELGHEALTLLQRQRRQWAGAQAPLYVAGEEAGGNLAAAVALMARDRAEPPLAGQILVAPMLDPCTGMPSLREASQCATGCKWAEGWQQYLRGPMDAEHPYAVPARARRLAGLPRTLILTGQDDAMRDEALAYGRRLAEAGIAVTAEKLEVQTGWPDSLADTDAKECPCTAAARAHLRRFFQAPTPPPS
jgi:acetyl esterase/lipase